MCTIHMRFLRALCQDNAKKRQTPMSGYDGINKKTKKGLTNGSILHMITAIQTQTMDEEEYTDHEPHRELPRVGRQQGTADGMDFGGRP